jgi:limonene-1,2-epoxide hydrolase
MQKNESNAKSSAKEIVTEFMQAWEGKDWKTVRSHISDNISVLAPGPFKPNTFHQAEAYMYYLEHSNYPPPEIKKMIADGNDVCLLYEMTYREPPPPLTTFVCGLFHVNDDDGKISSLRIVLDPRELFQKYFKR